MLARKAGFSSRSLIAEIFGGRRVPSYKAFVRLAALIGLSRAERDHLRGLIIRDYPKFDRSVDRASVELLLRKNRERLRPPKRKKLDRPVTAGNRLQYWPRVYAAAGGGKTAQEIAALVRLPDATVKDALAELVTAGLLSLEGDHYASDEAHVVLDPLLHRKIIESSILAECRNLPDTLRARYDDPQQLIFSGALMIRAENLEKLKHRLKSEFTKAIDQYFDAEGDVVVSFHGLVLK
jgi:hypothetical protein